MKKIRLFCLIMAALLLTQVLFVPVSANAEAQGASTLDAQLPLHPQPLEGITAQAVILYELTSDTMVYAWQPDAPVDPSGMNKIMTALLAIELGNPEDMVTITRRTVDSVAATGAVSANLQVDEQIKLRDLLFCMMVGSANDAAVAIAEHISGDPDRFVALMNQRATELGCTDTVFMNANGLSHESQHTTARDLAKITCAALEHPLFEQLFTAVTHTVPATNKSEVRQLETTNYMMSKESVRTEFDARVTGGKTGALTKTDRSLICTAQQDGCRYLSVVMSAESTVNGNAVTSFGNFSETRKLLDLVFQQYAVRQLLYAGQVMEQYTVSGGQNDVVVSAAADLYSALPKDMDPAKVTLKCVSGQLSAPIRKGQAIGTVEVWYQDNCVGSCDLLAMFDVNEPGVYDFTLMPTATESAKRTWTTVLLIGGIALLATVLIFVLVLVIRRHIILKKIERRHRLMEEG